MESRAGGYGAATIRHRAARHAASLRMVGSTLLSMLMVHRIFTLLCLTALLLLAAGSAGTSQTVLVSVIADRDVAAPARHGLTELKAALASRKIAVEQVSRLEDAHGRFVVMAGLAGNNGPAAALMRSLSITPPSAPESLLVRNVRWKDKPVCLFTGADATGLMYGLLDAAERLSWAAETAQPFSEVHDTEQAPAVAERGVTIFTMQQAQFENRLHDPEYWTKYFDNLARNRFNVFQVLFAYEMNGYMCPVYPYFVNVSEFPGVRVPGLTPEQQARNLADLNRLIAMAHERGIKVTIGLWCHYYRFDARFQNVGHDTPVNGVVFGVSEQNLIPYTRAALARFLHAVKGVDRLMLLMHGESGLKTEDMKVFWDNFYQVLKAEAPHMPLEIRAKGVSDDLVEHALELGLNMRVNTKYWSEQVGLPFHPTHVQELNQFERRHGYSDMLKRPREYELHWTLWTAGTTRALVWGDPEYARRFAETIRLGGVRGFDIMEPLATKMAGQPHAAQPFELLNPRYRYYDYEFERYWHFFQVFGRLSYNPAASSETWDREFARRFGKDAGPLIEQAVHRASQILPQIVAYCLPPLRFSTTRGWPERQRWEDLPDYAQDEPSDVEQFQSFAEAARNQISGTESARVSLPAESRWFADASSDVSRLVAEAERLAGPKPSNEFLSTITDLKILSNLALYHSRRIPAGLSMALFEQTHDANALDDAIADERKAIEAWGAVVHAAGDFYNFDLRMGLPEFDLSGHWRDEAEKLKTGLAALEKQRAAFLPETRRVVGRYDLGTGPALPGYERVTHGGSSMFETNGSNLWSFRLPAGRYQVKVGIKDDKKAHGPMWIEVNGVEYSDVFTVPAGQAVERTIETSAVNGKVKVLFDNATSADWYASTIEIARVDPLIAHAPVRRAAPGQDIMLRATVSGIDPIAHVRAHYGDSQRGFTAVEMDRVQDGMYRATIPHARSYFLEAVDARGRTSTWPQDGQTNPVPVLAATEGEPPALEHSAIARAKAGEPLRVSAKVRDASGVKWVRLRYRGVSQHQDLQTLPMLPTGKTDEYEAVIPAADVNSRFDLMYFFETMDNAGNGAIYPDLRKETPYVVVEVDSAGSAVKDAR